MAYAMTKQGSLDNCITYEFMCDTVADMNAIEDRYRTIGTVAIVLSGESGMEVYIASSDKQWNSLSSIGGGTAGGDTAGLVIHICAQDEVSNGLPDVELPDETTIYLVPASDASSGNLYDEYIYVDDKWEKFGSANIDLSGYYQKPVSGIPANDLASGVIPDVSGFAPKDSPVFINSISLGRKANTSIGNNSIAIGEQVSASGTAAYAEGNDTVASGQYSHAEGKNTSATNTCAHAEGEGNLVEGENSHAEGLNNYVTGNFSHAEGKDTTVGGNGAHAEGVGNQLTQRYINNIRYYGSGAYGAYSHTEGYLSWALANYAHAEGNNTSAEGTGSHAEGERAVTYGIGSHAEGLHTFAKGSYSHAEGNYTYAIGAYQHVLGQCNVGDSFDFLPEWTANTQYTQGDRVKRTTVENNVTSVQGYICRAANNNATFISNNWLPDNSMQYAEIVGNGNAIGTSVIRSNARALDWNGNEYLMGDLYIKCDSTSQNGIKVATDIDLQALLNRVIALEAKVAYLENYHIPETAVTDESGNQVTDESSNFITYNNLTN